MSNTPRIIALCLAIALASAAAAQKAPSWAKKAMKSVCAIMTYGSDGTLREKGQGVFIADDGTCVTDYRLLAEADSAVVVTRDGKTCPVAYVAGCDDIYDLAKLRVSVKSSTPLPLAPSPATVGDKVYVMLYSASKTPQLKTAEVTAVEDARDGDKYYTLKTRTKLQARSCPVINAEGALLGLFQGGDNDTTAYACGARMAAGLSFDAFMFQDVAASAIRLMKRLPDKESDAQVALVMGRPSMDDARYAAYLEMYKGQFPDSPYAYEQLAVLHVATDKDAAMDEIQEAYARYANEDEGRYALAKFKFAAIDSLGGEKGFSLQDALADVQRAIEVNPLPLYHQLKAQVETALGDYGAARASYAKVLDSNLCSVATINEYIQLNALGGAGDREQIALVDSLRSRYNTALGKDSVELLYTKAVYLDRVGDYNDALRCLSVYSAAYDELMTDAFFYYREQVAMKAKRYQQAMDDIKRALLIKPDEMAYLLEYAGLSIIANDYDNALAILERCHAMDKGNADINRLLGLSLLQLGRKDEARTYLTLAKDAGDDVAARLLEQYAN